MTVQETGTLAGKYSMDELQMSAGVVELRWMTDTLTIRGDAFLDTGMLRVVSTTPLNPDIGASWTLMHAFGGRHGQFANAILPTLPSDKSWRVSYTTTAVLLSVISSRIPGDYNNDGTVNAADYTVYRNRKAGIGGTTLLNDAGEVGVTIDDYHYWKAHYGDTLNNPGSGTTSSDPTANVPEPTSFVLLLTVAALMAVARRAT